MVYAFHAQMVGCKPKADLTVRPNRLDFLLCKNSRDWAEQFPIYSNIIGTVFVGTSEVRWFLEGSTGKENIKPVTSSKESAIGQWRLVFATRG